MTILHVFKTKEEKRNAFRIWSKRQGVLKIRKQDYWIDFEKEHHHFRTIEEAEKGSIKGCSWNYIYAPEEMRNSPAHHYIFIPSVCLTKGTIIFK